MVCIAGVNEVNKLLPRFTLKNLRKNRVNSVISAMSLIRGQLFSVCLLLAAKYSTAVELTFELADNAHECFYQDIDKGTAVTLEFQVSWGTRETHCQLQKRFRD